MAREAVRIELSPYEVIDLRRLANAPSTPQALAFRARIILRCDSFCLPDVPRNDHIAAELGCDPDTVAKWRGRFRRHHFAGLYDLPRSGRPAAFSP
jgi:putative transposase